MRCAVVQLGPINHLFPRIYLLSLRDVIEWRLPVLDGQGRACTAEQDFILFSLADAHLPVYSPEWFYQDGAELDARIR